MSRLYRSAVLYNVCPVSISWTTDKDYEFNVGRVICVETPTYFGNIFLAAEKSTSTRSVSIGTIGLGQNTFPVGQQGYRFH